MLTFNRDLKIANKVISDNSDVFIIAEAGVNHNGDMDLAKKLIEVAAETGADAIKFQLFRTGSLLLKNAEKADYQKETTKSEESQYEMLKKLEIRGNDIKYLINICKQNGIILLVTPFDEDSLVDICDLGLSAIKVASTDITNVSFLRKIAQTGKVILLSTGMSYMSEVELALETISQYNKNIVLLQCTSNYPTGIEDVNLSVLNEYKNKFDILLGYSDHTEGIGAAPFAIPLGAKVIEKHFTLDKSMEGPDHKASLSPYELKIFIEEIRKVEKFMGLHIKIPTYNETKTRPKLQKYIVAKCEISKGDFYSESNLCAKRTGGFGISASYFDNIIGKTSIKDYKKDDIIYL